MVIINNAYPAGIGLLPQRFNSVPKRFQIGEQSLVLLQQRFGRVLVLAVVLRVGHRLLLAHPRLRFIGVREVLLSLKRVLQVLFALWGTSFAFITLLHLKFRV